MKTNNTELKDFIKNMKDRNEAIEEAKHEERLNNLFHEEMANIGVICFTSHNTNMENLRQ